MNRITLRTSEDVLALLPDNVGINVYEATVYPNAARAFLDINCKNRPLQHAQISRLARAINDGNWKLINNGIAIDTNGDLSDGQHRLHACILANKPIKVLLCIGLAPDSRAAIDVGKKRNVRDALSMSGRVSSTHHAAAINLLKAYNEDRLRPFGALSASVNSRELAADHSEVLAFTETLDYELLNSLVNHAQRAASNVPGIRKSAWIAALYLISVKHPDKVSSFNEAVVEGDELTKLHPALILRNSAYRWRDKRADWHLCIYIKAWNAHLLGKTPSYLRFAEGESIPEVL